MFQIKTLPFGSYKLKIIENSLTGESVSFIPDFGATLNQLVLRSNNELHECMIGIKDYQELMTKGAAMFIGSKLFPFPNRINGGRYTWDKKTFCLPINLPSEGNAIHGLVYNKIFTVIDETVDIQEGRITLGYNQVKADRAYPFLFQLTIDISLTASGLRVNTTVKNTGRKSLPVGDGWHPYFKIGSSINALHLSVPAETGIEFTDHPVPLRKLQDDTYPNTKAIGISQLDHCYLLNQHPISTVRLMDLEKNRSLNIWIGTGNEKYNYVQLYTPPGRESIAIEPMTCMPDVFNHKKDLIELYPNQERSFTWGAYTSQAY